MTHQRNYKKISTQEWRRREVPLAFTTTFESRHQLREEKKRTLEGERRTLMEEKTHPTQTQKAAAKSHVWDCDSCLYDSFELQSFKRHLHSAIVSRSLSMPRLQEISRPAPPPTSTTSSKISRTFKKMLRSVFPAKWKSEKQSEEITAKEWEEKSVEVLVQEFDSMLLRASATQKFTRTGTLGMPTLTATPCS